MAQNFTGSGYIPDSTYTLILTYKETGKSKFGFQITCLDSATNSPAGTFTNPDSRSQDGTQSVSGKTRYYLGHTSTGTANVGTDSTAWNISWKAPSKNVGPVKFYAVVNVTNSNGSNAGDVIYGKIFQHQPSSLLPTAKAKITDPSICQFVPVNFDVTGTGSPTSYAWQFPGGSPSSSTLQKPQVTYGTAATYKAIVTVKNNKGFSMPDTLTFVVKQGASLPTLTPTGTRTICDGDSLKIQASTVTNHTYLWSTGKTGTSIFVKDTGSYALTVTLTSTGCKRTTPPVKILKNPKPIISVTRSFAGDTACAGVDHCFSVNNISAADSFANAQPFSWTKNSIFCDNIGTPQNKTVKFWGKSNQGCISSPITINYSVKAKAAGPVLSASTIGVEFITWDWTAVAGATAYMVSENSGSNWITPSSGSTGLTHSMTGLSPNTSYTFGVYAVVPGVCTSTEKVFQTVKTMSCSSLDFKINTDTNVCNGGSAQVVLTGLYGQNYSLTANGTSIGKDTIFSWTPSSGKETLTIQAVDSNALSCPKMTRSVHFNNVFVAVGNPPAKFDICRNVGQSYLFNTSLTATADTMDWYFNNIKVQSAASGNIQRNVSHNDSFYIVGRRLKCSATSSSSRINFIGALDAKGSSTNVGFDFTFTPNTLGGSHSWKIGDSLSTLEKPVVNLKAYQGQTIKVIHTVTTGQYCSNTDSFDQVVMFDAVVKLKSDLFRISPNPSQGALRVDLMSAGIFNYFISDLSGKTVLKGKLEQRSTMLDLGSLVNGIYLVDLEQGGRHYSEKIILKK